MELTMFWAADNYLGAVVFIDDLVVIVLISMNSPGFLDEYIDTLSTLVPPSKLPALGTALTRCQMHIRLFLELSMDWADDCDLDLAALVIH